MNEIMHVGIERPVERRKEILNIAIDAIQTLKDFEMSRRIVKEKSIYRKEFIRIVTELNNIIQQFQGSLPAVHVTHPQGETKEEIRLEKKEELRPVIKKFIKKKTHMDELEDDISRLRERIARL